jgi:hypothetical protein
MDVMPLLEEMASMPPAQKESLKNALAVYLNELLLHNFPALVQLLYHIDVSEKKLKTVLQENPQQDAGDLIAELLIARHQEKTVAKRTLRFPEDASDEERW